MTRKLTAIDIELFGCKERTSPLKRRTLLTFKLQYLSIKNLHPQEEQLHPDSWYCYTWSHRTVVWNVSHPIERWQLFADLDNDRINHRISIPTHTPTIPCSLGLRRHYRLLGGFVNYLLYPAPG